MTPSAPAVEVTSAERSRTTGASAPGIVAWYAEGVSDPVGDRLLLFDTAGPGLELLRLHPAIGDAPGFEEALRDRVERLRDFRHPSFSRVRSVTVLDDPRPQLALVSELVPGERLSRVLEMARLAGARPDPGTAVWLLRQLLPALGELHDRGGGLPHGLLTPDRVIVTPAGQLIVNEYVLGPAVAGLGLDRAALWRDLGVATAHLGKRAALDVRSDVLQVALLAVAVLRGRPLGRGEYPEGVLDVLDDACDRASWSLVPVVRGWLSRALALEAPPFESAHEAHDALDRLLPGLHGAWSHALLPRAVGGPQADARGPDALRRPVEPGASPRWANLLDDPHDRTRSRPVPPDRRDPPLHVVRPPASRGDVLPHERPAAAVGVAARHRETREASAPRQGATLLASAPGLFASVAGAAEPPVVASVGDDRVARRLWLLSAGLAFIAIAEAVCLVVVLVRGAGTVPPATAATATSAASGVRNGADTSVQPDGATASPGAPAPTSVAQTMAPGTAPPAGRAGDDSAAAPRNTSAESSSGATPTIGWVAIDSPYPWRVYANGRLLGPSSRGRFRLPSGRHDIRLVNEDLEATFRQEADVVGGKVTMLRPRVSRGR